MCPCRLRARAGWFGEGGGVGGLGGGGGVNLCRWKQGLGEGMTGGGGGG